MYLLDTNVISELRKCRPHGAVVEWIQKTVDGHLFISSVTLGEIQAGIELTRENNLEKARELESWANEVETLYNILPMDAAIFRLWATLVHRKSDTIYENAMIAATAIQHRLTVVTRNVRDFKTFPVETLNPFTR